MDIVGIHEDASENLLDREYDYFVWRLRGIPIYLFFIGHGW